MSLNKNLLTPFTGTMRKKRLLTRVPEYNCHHYTWSLTYRLNETGDNVQYLGKMDLDYIGDRDQIKVWNKLVKSYIQEKTAVVKVFMKLPEHVDRIIIFRFGVRDPVCFAENQGNDVYPGSELRKNPFTFDEELRRLHMSRRRRKLLF